MDTLLEINDKKPKEKATKVSKSINAQVNDLDPLLWRDYEEKQNLQFFTIWDTPSRDPYKWTQQTIHGNSPLEIQKQCILRFSKEGDKIIDPFCGSGTTLIVSAHLKREAYAVEVNPNIAKIAMENIKYNYQFINEKGLDYWLDKQRVLIGDSQKLDEMGFAENSFDFAFAHPPYGELVKYSNEYGYSEGDLSNYETTEDFNKGLKKIFQNIYKLLKPGKFFCVLIGEDFKKGGKTIPLDYYATQIGFEVGFEFYTKIIKVTRSASSRNGKENINKFRSLRSNYFICNHDYLIIFKKNDA